MIVIDVTEFDKSTNNLTEYGLTEQQFLEPFSTLVDLAKNPRNYINKKGDYRLILTEKQNQNLLKYLSKNNFQLESFGQPENAQFLLAFSFGENPDVNQGLAEIIQRIRIKHQRIVIAAQWEIANLLVINRMHSINLDDGKDYITTPEIIDKFIKEVIPTYPSDKSLQVFIVAQAWHAPRCIELCKAKRLNVIGGEFLDQFSPNDPQEWVRDAFSWVLKEGTKPNPF